MAKKHIFLSYCRENQADVRKLRGELKAAGEPVWWDQDILPGENPDFSISQALKESFAIVACLSAEAEARAESGIYPELADAIGMYRQYAPGKIFLIPVRLSECKIPAIKIDDTKTLDGLQYENLFPASNWAAGVKRLIEAIKKTHHHP